MPISSQRARVTSSEPITVTSAPRDIPAPAKRAKKSKESDCSSFSRAALYNETETSGDNQGSTGRKRGNAGPDINGKRRRPTLEETLGRLFGPYAQPRSIPRRRWELDSHEALFGPEGQLTTSENPRHYDIFELHRDMRPRRRKERLDDTQNELFGHMGDNIELNDHWEPSPPSAYDTYRRSFVVDYDRVFSQDLHNKDRESSDSELPTVV